jgi:hypothetical protein
MNKPKALVTQAYNMAVCSSILVHKITRQFEGDVVKYTGGDSITAGKDSVCVEWNVFPLPEYKNGERSPVQAWRGSRRLSLPGFQDSRHTTVSQPYAPAAFTPWGRVPGITSWYSTPGP